jgi:hypothetical protein
MKYLLIFEDNSMSVVGELDDYIKQGVTDNYLTVIKWDCGKYFEWYGGEWNEIP